jgi:hypothetical protein
MMDVTRQVMTAAPKAGEYSAPVNQFHASETSTRENFYAHNPIGRYAITSGMPLQYNPDGSLDVYIQAQSPGPDREANWLPCPPSGPFNVTIRVYQPKRSMLDGQTENHLVVQAGTYQIPPIQEVGQIEGVPHPSSAARPATIT